MAYRYRAGSRHGLFRKVAQMKRQFLVLSLGFGALILATHHAYAQENQNCAPRDRVVHHLNTTFGETRQSIALGPNNAVVEMFASATTGTWTLTVTRATGVSCIVASGDAYEALADAPAAPGKDA